jgi:predicted O-methyltransferase YrrM
MLNIIKKIYTKSPKQNLSSLLKYLKNNYNSEEHLWDIDILNDISVSPKKWNNNRRTNYTEIDFSNVEFYDIDVLNEIEDVLKGEIEGTRFLKSEMSYKERAFLNGIIRKANPKTIVEIGLSAGGSTCVILNAIRDMDSAQLYSFDYNTTWYRDLQLKNLTERKTGFLVNQLVPNLTSKWKLYTGGVPCKYFDILPDEGIDICFIDTAHFNPGEHLNILEILPFMKKNSIIIYHDTVYHTKRVSSGTTNCVSINTLNGARIVLRTENTNGLANIGAVILDDNIENTLYGLFSNVSLPWSYKISHSDFVEMYKHFSKYYSQDLVQIYAYYCCFYISGGLNNHEKSIQFAENAVKILKNHFIDNVK